MAEADRGSRPRHPRHARDENLLPPIRLSLMAAVGEAEVDFLTLRDVLDTSDSVLSKAIAHLSEAGYLKVRKGYVGNRPRTWVTATARGRRAFATHVRALEAIVRGTGLGAASPGDRR
jgi:DNA-binding MarR family transcriptional regulator